MDLCCLNHLGVFWHCHILFQDNHQVHANIRGCCNSEILTDSDINQLEYQLVLYNNNNNNNINSNNFTLDSVSITVRFMPI